MSRSLTVLADRPAYNLDDLKIAAPCDQKWEQMRGDDVKRFCEACTLNVYNLEGMRRDEIQTLLIEHEGQRVCGRLFKRSDGTLITADCPVGLAEKAWRHARNGALTAAASMISVALFLLGVVVWFTSARIEKPEPNLMTEPTSWQVDVKVPPPVEELEKKRIELLEKRELAKPGGMMYMGDIGVE